MRKYIILLISTIFIILVIGNIDISAPSKPVIAEPLPIVINEKEETDYYIAQTFDEKVAIFVPYESEPFLITEINIKTLPSLDQEKLNLGIILDESYPLNKFIEDFTS